MKIKIVSFKAHLTDDELEQKLQEILDEGWALRFVVPSTDTLGQRNCYLTHYFVKEDK